MDNTIIEVHSEVNSLYEKLKGRNGQELFAFKGIMNDDVLGEILSRVEDTLSEHESLMKLQRRINVIAVEILQNIFHHFEGIDSKTVLEPPSNIVLFLLSKDKDAYYIVAGNYVPIETANFLKERIDSINELTVEELKKRYRKVLSNGDFSEQGGAGLGIIDIARKSGQKLDYEFSSTNETHSFFTIKVSVPI
ncbi:SiaB family protein kinase [Flammeovirga yaeyamensis]|uniref:SiaB family protein kinase n=1 Tax=Flammeovirga yaeyamensis TaxID=367791 RepID=A0AAX1MYN7_9BACT|nr:SiaB family protein kinase [Flammeovirga yaeyamensis]NMF34929.1 hypothetical protein [Flammeovirga yaeyamensis]QWG00246.1 SiaB family protein kinase [Flammeovirga yaeyamensis]